MLWEDLLKLLINMEASKHSAFTEHDRVSIIVDNEEFYVDLHESLTSGKIYLVHATLYPEVEDNG